MAIKLLNFQHWFVKIGHQLSLSWEKCATVIVHTINLIGCGSGTFDDPGMEAERAVRTITTGGNFNGPNLGCEQFFSLGTGYQNPSVYEPMDSSYGTSIDCCSDATYCDATFRAQFTLAALQTNLAIVD